MSGQFSHLTSSEVITVLIQFKRVDYVASVNNVNLKLADNLTGWLVGVS